MHDELEAVAAQHRVIAVAGFTRETACADVERRDFLEVLGEEHGSDFAHVHDAYPARAWSATTKQQIAQNKGYSAPPKFHIHLPADTRQLAHAATSRNTPVSMAT